MRQDVTYYCICIAARNHGEDSLIPKFACWRRYFYQILRNEEFM